MTETTEQVKQKSFVPSKVSKQTISLVQPNTPDLPKVNTTQVIPEKSPKSPRLIKRKSSGLLAKSVPKKKRYQHKK